jgi:hypothetical protein
MFIAQTVHALSKLRQERHGDERHKQRRVRASSSKHAAPDGAWVVFVDSSAIDMALLAELTRSQITQREYEQVVDYERDAFFMLSGVTQRHRGLH